MDDAPDITIFNMMKFVISPSRNTHCFVRRVLRGRAVNSDPQKLICMVHPPPPALVHFLLLAESPFKLVKLAKCHT
jgi:hypothetical protein